MVGIDDFAFRIGRYYGTVIIDLERHQIIDMLPDIKAETLKDWLADHPTIQVISRDRAGAYASGSRDGAPQARQVADRFHLLKNTSDVLQRILKQHSHPIREAFESIRPPEEQLTTTPINDLMISPSSTAMSQLTPAQERREERRQAIIKLITDGKSIRAVTQELKMNRKTVKRYLNNEHIPVNARGKETRKTNPES